jgi:zinc protease
VTHRNNPAQSLLARSALLLVALLFAAAAGAAPQKTATIEGVTEYRLDNGLRVLSVPDAGTETLTVHITYLVGSRHESYGERGMAHLLEHLLFKSSKNFPNIKDELTRRGGRFNGSTSYDRTNYYETFAASESDLDWALRLEADRMVNATVSRADLDSEMSVVRNEFEMGENSAGSVLYQRMQRALFAEHNYGFPTIGTRSDIENVPIERLQAFYRTWYQPDNAVLVIAGRFDEAKALALVERHFGAIPKPARALPRLYTVEPTQDGERTVTLRRAGETPLVSAMYRAPAASHPDYPAIEVLTSILGTSVTGRLHNALVRKGIATSVWGSESSRHDPGLLYFGATLPSTPAGLDGVRDAILAVVEGFAADPVRAEEVERAKTALLNDMARTQLETRSLVQMLSEFSALGDWRLFYLYRDRLRAVKLEDVQRVALHYLKPSSRVTGAFIPTSQPQRAEIPQTPDLQAALKDYRGGERAEAGEFLDPSPEAIEKRVIRSQLGNGIAAAFLPKKTRGERVYLSLTLRWGDEASRTNRDLACGLAGSMLMRGTLKHTRAELRDLLEKMNASVSVGADGATIEVARANLEPALRLVAEALREPAFPASEFEELKRLSLTRIEGQRGDPSTLAAEQISRHLQPYPRGHPYHTLTIDERLQDLKAMRVEDAAACYRDMVGATGAQLAAVGDFEPAQLARLAEELFGEWRTPRPYARIPARHFDLNALERELLTPDKANAVLRAGMNLAMRDDHPDYPAMVLANYLLGGPSTARLTVRVREKEGLSYSTYSSFSASALDASASFAVSAIYAPSNKDKVRTAVVEEISRALKDGFPADEVETGKKSWLEARRLSRSQDRAIVGRLGTYLFLKRSFMWDAELERKVAALTPQQVHEAMQKHIDPRKLSIIRAGDFKS